MNADTLEAAVTAFRTGRPFRPFTVSLNGGERIEIDRPDFVFRGGTIGFVSDGGVPQFAFADQIAAVLDGPAGAGPCAGG